MKLISILYSSRNVYVRVFSVICPNYAISIVFRSWRILFSTWSNFGRIILPHLLGAIHKYTRIRVVKIKTNHRGEKRKSAKKKMKGSDDNDNKIISSFQPIVASLETGKTPPFDEYDTAILTTRAIVYEVRKCAWTAPTPTRRGEGSNKGRKARSSESF